MNIKEKAEFLGKQGVQVGGLDSVPFISYVPSTGSFDYSNLEPVLKALEELLRKAPFVKAGIDEYTMCETFMLAWFKDNGWIEPMSNLLQETQV